MKKNKWITLLLVGVAVCSVSWQRSGAGEQCKKNRDTCSKSKDMCQADYDACMDDAAQQDEDSFLSSATSDSADVYDNFTSMQKKQAMDYADGNKMPPDEAIAKVARLSPK